MNRSLSIRTLVAAGAATAALGLSAHPAGAATPDPSPATPSSQPSAENSEATMSRLQQQTILAQPAIVLIQITESGFLNDNRTGKTLGEVGSDGYLTGNPLSSSGVGTGFFVSNDGYIVTAAHVAAPTHEMVHVDLVDEYLREASGCSGSQCAAVLAKYEDQYMTETAVNGERTDVKVFTQDMSDPSKRLVGYTAEVKASSPTSAHDTAVIKVSLANTPAVQLGDSDKVNVQDSITVLGYPHDALNMSNRSTVLVPSISRGTITARKQGGIDGIATDANVFQTDAGIQHGNSGGPAVAESGKVIGLVSYGGQTSVNYLIQSNDIADVIRQAAVPAAGGHIDALWHDGFNAYLARQYHTAEQLLSQCASLSQVQTGCVEYARKSTALFGQEPAPASQPSAPGLMMQPAAAAAPAGFPVAPVGGGAALVALLGVGLVLWSRSRRPAAPVLVPPPGSAAGSTIAVTGHPVAHASTPQFSFGWAPSAQAPVAVGAASNHLVCRSCLTPAAGTAFCGTCGTRVA